MKWKGLKISLAILGTIVILISVIHPIPIYLSDGDDIHQSIDYQKGDTVKVLGDSNFNEGDWEAYIVLVWGDNNRLHKEIPKGIMYRTDDIELLKQMQRDWRFEYTGGDIATVQNQFILYQDGKIIVHTGIVIDDNFTAFQGWFGALYPNNKNDIIKYCKQFKRVYSPIVIL